MEVVGGESSPVIVLWNQCPASPISQVPTLLIYGLFGCFLLHVFVPANIKLYTEVKFNIILTQGVSKVNLETNAEK